MIANLHATAQELGLPFGIRNKTYNSRLAQELGLWAEDQGKGEALHLAVFHAYFAEGLNLAKMEILLDLARKAGLPEKEAEKILINRTYKAKVDRDWADSRLQGISAVPTFVMGQHKVVGAQSYQTLKELVTFYGVTARSEKMDEKRKDEDN